MDYLADSIQFIGFIVDVEKTFEMEMPDEYLLYDSIASLHSFAEIIRNYFIENMILLYAVEGGTNHNSCNSVAGC